LASVKVWPVDARDGVPVEVTTPFHIMMDYHKLVPNHMLTVSLLLSTRDDLAGNLVSVALVLDPFSPLTVEKLAETRLNAWRNDKEIIELMRVT